MGCQEISRMRFPFSKARSEIIQGQILTIRALGLEAITRITLLGKLYVYLDWTLDDKMTSLLSTIDCL